MKGHEVFAVLLGCNTMASLCYGCLPTVFDKNNAWDVLAMNGVPAAHATACSALLLTRLMH